MNEKMIFDLLQFGVENMALSRFNPFSKLTYFQKPLCQSGFGKC